MTIAHTALIWIKVKLGMSDQPYYKEDSRNNMNAPQELIAGLEAAVLSVGVAAVRRAHADKLALCDRLEAIADSLPNELDRRECLLAARALGPRLAKIHRYEENHVFPLFCSRFCQTAEARETVERLKCEHFEDESYAAELREALRAAARRGRAEHPETLGFMLRGFFGALRRHIAFESDHVLAQLVPHE